MFQQRQRILVVELQDAGEPGLLPDATASYPSSLAVLLGILVEFKFDEEQKNAEVTDIS
jgi:hypothetical protein